MSRPSQVWTWHRSALPVLAALVGLLAAGCGSRPAPAPLPAKAVTVKPAPVNPAPPSSKAVASSDKASGQPPAEPAKDSGSKATTTVAAASPIVQPPPPAPTFSTERIVLLTPNSPLIVEFQFSIDGAPHTQALARLVEEVLKIADTDGDGRPTWKEVTESKRFKYGQFGNVAITNENAYKQVAEQYDADRDGVVDTAELPRFLTRNAGSARAFSVRGSADFRGGAREAPLWKLLDADEDAVLSAEERAGAPGRLLSRDTDDDEILAPSDVGPQVPLDPGMMTQRRRAGTTVVRLLGPHADWDNVRRSLEGQYSGNDYLRADSFPLTPDLFAQLDKNGDGKLLKAEFPGLNDVRPHIVLAVSFGKAPKPESAAREGEAVSLESAEPPGKDDDPPPTTEPASENTPPEPAIPQLRLVSLDPQLADGQNIIAEQTGRLTLRVGGVPITFYLNDTVAGGDFDAQAQQALMALDTDKNGYLEASEVPENAAPQLGQFAAVDADENGKIYADEIVVYLKQQQAGLRAQIHARASDRDDALFALVDQNHDERLDAREIEAVPERLAAFDANSDSLVADDEVPQSLAVGLARGNLENMEALFVPPPLVARAPAEGTPRWFTSMDANADGAISSREFLGPMENFASLDTSGDGLVDVLEAKAVEAPAGP